MYSTMRLQHKAQDCSTAASLSLRRQCWASDRCCYEYDSHVSGLWASQGQWVVAGKGLRGECQRLSCKRRLSRTTYLCLQRCGKSVPCPPVRLICIFCACLVPYELVALTHTLTTAVILAHILTHMLQLLHLWNSAAVSLFVVVAFIFYELFWQFSAGLRQATHSKGNYRWMNSAHYTPLHFPLTPSHPKVVASSLAAGWRCSALLCSGRAIISEMFWLALAFMLIYWLLRFCDKSVLLTWCDFASLVPSSLLLIFPLPNTLPPPPGTVVRPRCCGFKLPESFISSNLVLYLLDAAKL